MKPFLNPVPVNFVQDVLSTLDLKVVSSIPGGALGKFDGMYTIQVIDVAHIPHMIAASLASSPTARLALANISLSMLNLTKIACIIIAHELVHVWQHGFREEFLARRVANPADLPCLNEAHATAVTTKVARASGLGKENWLGLQFLKAVDKADPKRDHTCYYNMQSTASQDTIQWWAHDDVSGDGDTVYLIRDEHNKPIEAKRKAGRHRKASSKAQRTRLQEIARREARGVPLSAQPRRDQLLGSAYAKQREKLLKVELAKSKH